MTVYYVDAADGADGNDGRSERSAWATFDRVGAAALRPGDAVLFRRGRIWRGSLQLRRSGTADRPITIGAYGEGANPLFLGARGLSGAEWTPEIDGLWSTTLAEEPGQVFLDDRPGARAGGLAQVTGPGEWFWSGRRLFVGSPGPPTEVFGLVEAAVMQPIYNHEADFVRYENLRVAKGHYVGLRVSSSRGIELLNIEAFDNAEDGIRLTGEGTAECTVRKGASHHNGRATNQASGHGYIFVQCAADCLLEDVESYENAHDGVQVGGLCGTGHLLQRINSHDNGFSGFNVKTGKHVIRFVRSTGNGKYGLMAQVVLDELHVTDSVFLDNGKLHQASNGEISLSNLKLEDHVALRSERNLWGQAHGEGALAHSDGAAVTATFTGDVFLSGHGDKQFVTFWGEAGTSFTFTHCTFFKKTGGSGVLWFEPGVGSFAVTNSILVHHGSRIIRYHEATRATLDHNLYHRPNQDNDLVLIDGATERSYSSHDVRAGAMQRAEGLDPHAIVGDPLFAAEESGNLSLSSGSPARAAGSRDAGVIADHRRAPYGTPPDIGALSSLSGAVIDLGQPFLGLPALRPGTARLAASTVPETAEALQRLTGV